MAIEVGQPVAFRPGAAFEERWGPGQLLAGTITSINAAEDIASIRVEPDNDIPFVEQQVLRDDSLGASRRWKPVSGTSGGSGGPINISDVTGLQAALDSKLPLVGGQLTGDLTFRDDQEGVALSSGGELYDSSVLDSTVIQARSGALDVRNAAGTNILQIRSSTSTFSFNGFGVYHTGNLIPVAEAPSDSIYYARRNGAWASANAVFVAKSGDTMSGPLVLPAANPAAPQEAAHKKYVDEVLAAATGGTITEAPNDGKTYGRKSLGWYEVVGVAGATMTGPLVLSAAPTADLGAATKLYVDQRAFPEAPADGNFWARRNLAWFSVSANFVKLTGDTLTGFLTLHADPSSAMHAATKQYADTKAPASHTHTSLQITDWNEAVDDRVGALMVAGTNITLNYNDASNQLTIAMPTAFVAKAGDTMSGFLTFSDFDEGLTFAGASKIYDQNTLGSSNAGRLTVLANNGSFEVLNEAGTVAILQAREADSAPLFKGTAISLVGHTHSQSDVTNLVSDLALKAPLASPALTGTPTVPTATAGTNTTQAASTAFVTTAVATKEPTITAGTTSQYWRGDKSWQTLPAPGISDAPSDGNYYARRNLAWVSASAAFVIKTGDTMTGALVLSGAPTADLQAATKLYADSSGRDHGQCILFLSGGNLVLGQRNGNKLIINGVARDIASAGVTLAPTGLTPSTLYYIYAYWTGSAIALEASTTARTPDTNGVSTKTGDATRTFVGLARPIAGPAFVDSITQRFVRSYFNRQRRTLSRQLNPVPTLTATAATEFDSALRLEFVSFADDVVSVTYNGGVFNSGANYTYVGPGLNGISLNAFVTGLGSNMQPASTTAHLEGLGDGYQYACGMGMVSGGTGTYSSNAFFANLSAIVGP